MGYAAGKFGNCSYCRVCCAADIAQRSVCDVATGLRSSFGRRVARIFG